MNNKVGKQTIKFNNIVSFSSGSSIVGKREGEGPLGEYFDFIEKDEYCGECSFEKAETSILSKAVLSLINKNKMDIDEIDILIGGDLLNQLAPTNFMARDLGIPFLGIYGACSNMAEGLIIGSILIDAGYSNKTICTASSHFCSAERQYRLPLEQGGQRPLYAQWTVTGSGATLLTGEDKGPYITYATIGHVVDFGITDANNMGAAMAPAAADTIIRHLEDTGRSHDYYNLIVTGDLGQCGLEILKEILLKNKYDINNITDCGAIIFNRDKQDVHSGGSGCGCSAVVLNAYFYQQLIEKSLNKILFVGTGALLAPVTAQQGENIPCIAHAVSIENMRCIK